MKIFISWSGDRSRRVAEALRSLLTVVIPNAEPWLSGQDIVPGARWQLEIARQLEETDFGILVVTQDNLHAPWLLFEAGALSKSLRARVCPYLVDVAFKDLSSPLSQFQSVLAIRESTLALILSMNDPSGPSSDDEVRFLFEQLWPTLDNALSAVNSVSTAPSFPEQETTRHRGQDPLTSLLDRAALSEDLTKDVTAAEHTRLPLSIVFLDVDHFKRINDKYGHLKGDEVLRTVASTLQLATEGKGQVYRFGGEEFLLILPNHTWQEAAATAERVRIDLESSKPGGLEVTASFGVASFPEHQSDPIQLMSAADAAMYDAKQRGRNLVRVFREMDPSLESVRTDRKMAEPGRVTEAEGQRLRLLHFKGERIMCPDDGAILIVDELNYLGSSTTGIRMRCPVCGFNADVLGS